MPRRYNKSTEGEQFFNEIAELAALLPVWVTIPIAILLYIFVPFPDLNTIALKEQSSMAIVIVKIFFLIFAKYLVPAALAVGAIVNVINKIKSSFLFGSISRQGAQAVINKLSWQDFEFLLSEWFKKQGYTTELTGGGGADGGIDIKLYKDGKLYFVQCKHYKASKVPVMVVRELNGVMSALGAVGGFVVTSGYFTSEAYFFAKNVNIELIDKKKLLTIFDTVGNLTPQTVITPSQKCPKCGNELVEKTGKFGQFLGCSTYPKCSFSESL